MNKEISKDSKPLVVVVNDDPVQLSLLSLLAARAGAETLSFESVEKALSGMEKEGPVALIITDLYMPGIDGWRFCRLLRSSDFSAFNNVPIIVVSATFSGEEPKRIAADLGAEAFFHFPFDRDQFISQIQVTLKGGKKQIDQRVLIVEDNRSTGMMLENTFNDSGYRVTIVSTLKEADEAFLAGLYDIAVIDYHLPDGKGDTLLEKHIERQAECVFIMITIDPGADLALQWMKKGAAAYLRKPFKPEYLVELCFRARRERMLLRVEDLLEARSIELKESEDRFRTITEQTGDLILLSDINGIISYASPASFELSGYLPQEICGRHYTDFLDSSSDTEALSSFKAALLKGKKIKRAVFMIKRKDSSSFTGEVNASIFKLGKNDSVMIVIRDISGRKKAEKEIKLLAGMLDLAPSAIMIHDYKGVFLYTNRKNLEYHGYTRSEWMKLNLRDIDVPESSALIDERMNQLKKRGEAEFEVSHYRRDGTIFPMQIYIKEVEWLGLPAILSIGTDISENRQATEEKEKLYQQLVQAQKMESVGRLAGGVAHDFNNMLSVIMGHTEMILDNMEKEDPLYPDLVEIRKAAERSAELTRQLLAFARRQPVLPKVINLDKTVEEMLKMLKRLIGEDIELSWIPGGNLWKTRIDLSQVDQILANLCINARDAICGTGKVTIETGNIEIDEHYCSLHPGFSPGEYVELSVSDNGCGMGSETIEKLFEPFFTTKETGKGTGLGLATVYGIIKQNNGFINVYSEPGYGSTFRIFLPRYKGDYGVDKKEPERGRIKKGIKTILLVEDEPAILNMTSMMLKHLGYTVLAASSPGEAITIAGSYSGEIHLLVTDVIMPEMNGRELAKKLLETHPSLKRLFMSGYTANIIASHGVLEEGVFFIQKPFTIKDLSDRVWDALEKK